MRRIFLNIASSLTRNYVTLLLLSACGIEVGNPKKPHHEMPPAQDSLFDDFDEASLLVSANVDEVVSSLTDDFEDSTTLTLMDAASSEGPSSAGGFALTDGARLAGDAAGAYDSHCAVAQDGSAAVSYSSTIDGSGMNRTGTRKIDYAVTGAGKDVYQATGKALRCGLAQKRVAIDARTFQNLKISSTYELTRNRDITSIASGAIVRSDAVIYKGVRVTILNTEAGGTAEKGFRINQEISKDVANTFVSKRANGKTISLESRLTTGEGQPLKISADYPRIRAAWARKEIRSGKLISIQKDGSIVELTMSSVVFEAGFGCVPRSGSMSGSIVYPDGARTNREFILQFSSEDPKVVFSTGEVYEVNFEGCRLD